MGSRQTAGGKEGFWILRFILLGVSELFWLCWHEVQKKKKPYGSSSVPSLPTSARTCALPAHTAHSLAKGSQRQAFIYIYLNQSIKVRKGRGGATKCANPPVVWVFFSPALSCLGAPCVWWQRGCAVVTMMGRSRQLRGSREITAPSWQLRPATGQATGSWESWGLFFQLSLIFVWTLSHFSAYQFPDDSPPTRDNSEISDLPSLRRQEGPMQQRAK